MSCFNPKSGYITSDGKFFFHTVKTLQMAYEGKIKSNIIVPCNKCDGCRAERARQWAIRCSHEAQLHTDNCFITLTYDDEHLPSRGLVKSDVQNFIKVLRRSFDYHKSNNSFKYFACGEYGSETFRPHYHLLLFGYCPTDLIYLGRNPETKGVNYVSPWLTLKWNKGHVTVTPSVNYEICAYVARYVNKKQLERKLDNEVLKIIEPPFNLCSRRPAIGREYYTRFVKEIQGSDEVVLNMRTMCPPKYYDKVCEQIDPLKYNEIKERRLDNNPYFKLSYEELKKRYEAQVLRNKQVIENKKRGL